MHEVGNPFLVSSFWLLDDLVYWGIDSWLFALVSLFLNLILELVFPNISTSVNNSIDVHSSTNTCKYNNISFFYFMFG